MFKRALLSIALLTTTATAQSMPTVPQDAAPTKRPVRTQDDLPRHRYPVTPSAEALLSADDATFNAWAAQVSTDIDATLRDYDIQDRATLRELLGRRLNIELLTHRNEAALATIAALRAAQDKPDAKLTSGLRAEAIVRARIATGQTSGPAFEQAFAKNYAVALDALPWAITGTALKEDRQRAQLMSPTLVDGFVRTDVEPIVTRERAVSDKPADDLIWARMMRQVDLPVQPLTITALGKVVAAKNVAKPDIWTAREVTLTPSDHPTPIVVGIWDSGTDVSLFPQQLYTDPRPRPPANAHGVAFDIDDNPTNGTLYPLTADQQRVYGSVIADFQGLNDLEQAIDSPAADAVRRKISGLPSEAVPAFLEQMKFYGQYMHGTHVAGIVARGNPAVRLAIARRTFDYRNIPAPPTDASVARGNAAAQATINWFRQHGVRVVNMSWGGTAGDFESDLEKNGIGKDTAERKALARRYFEANRDGLYAAIKGAPEILFVAAAGNSNSDNAFDEAIPSSFVLPNMITVSAVDRAGDEASFTTYGSNVAVSANGYQVQSLIPGGTTLESSGTSMAAPNVANLAAKLIALDPKLTPAATIKLIRDGASVSADGRRHNIDPKASVALLRTRPAFAK